MKKLLKPALAVALSSLVLLTGISGQAAAQGAAKVVQQASAEDQAMALKTLNSFYKPALNGQFPVSANMFTIGVSTRKQVIGKIGQPNKPRTNATGFDVYHAEMGNPGYAFAYNNNKLREVRYFGTNVERQTNIGGITKRMLLSNWFAPSESVTIRNGSLVQQKITYNRGKYKLEFIFNTSTNLDHINMLKR
ncbi:hypothetical protein BK138_35565 [Paenibacillus rhizosphaerae]|uniref:DUF4309 domain-containing protein n=1 Tax=Paenibacillus rhizosphaerae TaxID=297318 RepID=A0A1R1DTR9_9BACL|nr:YjgB family protein [Paenibacillus rhizosphaerae]OMF42949.1 hypothetical protein BK138_35565 [Paenibacillus rhizosphaerae]